MKLSVLARETAGARLVGGDAEIKGLRFDSRITENGDLFFCYRGTHSDSHAYAAEAERRGAVAIVCEREADVNLPQLIVSDGREAMARIAAGFYGHPEKKLSIVGVTGTNGKTTVSQMLYRILECDGRRAGVIGTLGGKFPSAEIAPTLTTPDSVFLFSLLADMVRAKTEIAVMEVSAHALALKKEVPICYDTAVFTNLTQDHLDFFGDMQSYGAAKKSLFTPQRCRFAVINSDDPFSRELIGEVPYISYGLDAPSDSFALIRREEIGGTRALLNLNDELCDAEICLTGRHNVYNALAAATAARRYGVGAEAIAAGLKSTRVDGRLECVARHRGAEIVVDFAHTPDGLEKSLLALKEYCTGRLIVLFGCGGNRDREKRPLMGATAARFADFAVLTSDNPRFEEPLSIISEIERGFRAVSRNYTIVEERERATEYAIGMLREGDILLVAGKGGEREQEIMGIKYGYSDKTVIENILGKLQ